MSKIISILLTLILLSACAGMPAGTPVSEPRGTPTSQSNMACSVPTTWDIQYNRSGGFAGFNQSMTLDNGGNLTVKSERPAVDVQKTLSDEQVKDITELLVGACPFKTNVDKGNCADCFVYDLNVQMDGQVYSVHASDVTLSEELQPLINALSQLLQDTN
jgi:hypothetical protein